MAETDRPDVCVIGAGSAGLAATARARAMGGSVVLVERGAMGGGSVGASLPARALTGAAERVHHLEDAAAFGIGAGQPRVNFSRVNAHVHAVVDASAPNVAAERYRALGADVVQGAARFVDPRTLAVGERRIRARRFIIAAGSHPAIPDVPGLESVPYLTTDTVFALTERPDHLIVLGGSAVAAELAQAHLRLGAEVTLIEALEPLPHDDPELAEIVARRLSAEGMTILSHTGVVSVAPDADGVAIEIKSGAQERTITGTHLLVATGRRPAAGALGLEAARVRYSARGITVNAGLRTSNRRIYAVGDITGGMPLASRAAEEAERAVDAALLGQTARRRAKGQPWVTYTDPEIAHVGLTEPAARRRHKLSYRVVRWPFVENGRAQALRRTEGLAKLVVARNGRILGASVVGPQAGEVIALFAYAIANGLKADTLAAFAAPYPTLATLASDLGREYRREQFERPWRARWMALNRLLP